VQADVQGDTVGNETGVSARPLVRRYTNEPARTPACVQQEVSLKEAEQGNPAVLSSSSCALPPLQFFYIILMRGRGGLHGDGAGDARRDSK
jgi:hypothetical protein